jgi:hypothetical protein
LLNTRGLDPFVVSRIENCLQATNEVVDIHVESKATPLGPSHGKKLADLVNIPLLTIRYLYKYMLIYFFILYT